MFPYEYCANVISRSRRSVSIQLRSRILNVKLDEHRTRRLAAVQVQQANEPPLPVEDVRQPHRGDGQDGVGLEAVIALDQDAHEDELVVLVRPLERLVPQRFRDGRGLGVAFHLCEQARELVPFVGRRLALLGRGGDGIGVQQRAGHVRLDLALVVAGRDGDVGRAGNVQLKLLLSTRVEHAVAAGAQGGWFEDVAVGAREEGFVDLHACAKGLPVHGADLGADGPEGDGVQVLGGDARAFGEDAHQVLGVVFGNLGDVGG